jgi:hypothetical protein
MKCPLFRVLDTWTFLHAITSVGVWRGPTAKLGQRVIIWMSLESPDDEIDEYYSLYLRC